MMTPEDIWNTIVELSHTQGCYSSLKRRLEESGDKEKKLQELAAIGFKDKVQFILWMEE